MVLKRYLGGSGSQEFNSRTEMIVQLIAPLPCTWLTHNHILTYTHELQNPLPTLKRTAHIMFNITK